ncbi:MAG: aminodeoxychorismate/anthranilate synthase component II [Firmicutes bacterium]|jgi:para-aminobenzoate synthetase component 2|nr:aminodeoxychorismate/anthranilate synthase component II [Bacillota bacterium]
MILMIDNYDSFTYNLVNYLEMLGKTVVVRRNDMIEIDEIKAMSPELIVISPGPGNPMDGGICLDIVDKFKGVYPILGICLGFQIIASYFGANIIRAREPVHGKVFPISHDGRGIFRNIENPTNVTRYHSLVLDESTLGADLEVTSFTEDNVVMGIRHKKYKISGVQFHPEALLTEKGIDMLRNALLYLEGR